VKKRRYKADGQEGGGERSLLESSGGLEHIKYAEFKGAIGPKKQNGGAPKSGRVQKSRSWAAFC